MSGEACKRPGCGGSIEDGYCNLCGHAAVKSAAAVSAASAREPAVGTHRPSAAITTGTGSTPIARASAGTRRTSHSSSRTTRKQLGAGLVTLPDLPSVEPERAVMLDPTVPERKRFCSRCDAPLKREAGFCGKCGMKYSFIPSLRAGDVVAGQYAVKGPIAFGGLGWIYLAFDTLLSRYVVLKGLLNTQDESAASAAMAERQFLAAVKHPNIVGIYNFVQFGTEGFIVMEYVGGKTLKQIRQERGPLPADEAIAYIHRILPCFGYLHRLGLVYCDFKPDNVMMERDDVKLIDLGGVRRLDDAKGDIYGTVGYSAPEAGGGPTPASDLYTVGRTLAVLLTDIRGFSSDHRYSLPSPAEEPKFAGQESLYRFLLKSTADNADDRFETADEMAEQLLGVLREVVAVQTGTPRPSSSLAFGTDLLALDAGSEMEPVEPQYKVLPSPAIDIADGAAQTVSSASATAEPGRRVAALQMAAHQFPKSREARLRLAEALSDVGEFSQAEDLLKKLAEEDAWDWRVLWFQGRMRLVQAKPAEARKLFDQVYFDLPGEIAPKLALALSAELHGDLGVAAKMYDLVSRTDPTYTSAAFGLARCHFRNGDRTAAVAALDRIPQSSALYLRARVEATRMFVRQGSAAPKLDDLVSASSLVESLSLEEINRLRLTSQIFTAAVAQAGSRTKVQTGPPGTPPARNLKILGRPVVDRELRLGLESSLRGLARFMDGEERIHLVDQANQVRPMTLI